MPDSTFPGGQETLGQPMYPWLMRWNGPHAAPTTGYENQALSSMSNFAGNGFGLNGAQNYLQGVMGGQWLNPNNQYFDQIQSSGQNLLKGQQYDALKELQSRAAAGGNALGGALMSSEGRYLNDSNNSFNNMMATLRANQYARERGYMQEAPNQLNQLSQTGMQGLGQLMNMGAVPRQIEDQEIQGQYNDWLRQINSLREQNRYPDRMAQEFLSSNRYASGLNQPQYGNSTADQLIPLLAMLLGAGGKDGLGAQLGTAGGNALSNLLNGGNKNNQNTGGPDANGFYPTNTSMQDYVSGNQYDQPLGPQQPNDYSFLDQYFPQYADPGYNQYDPYGGQSYFDPNTFDFSGY
jgi:hypothetical protein